MSELMRELWRDVDTDDKVKALRLRAPAAASGGDFFTTTKKPIDVVA